MWTKLLVLFVAGVLAPLPSGAVCPADLAQEAPDVVFTASIRQKAAELGFDPVRIHEFVRNEFDYQHYIGLMRGPEATLRVRRGNDYDLAATLVSLLRVSEDLDGNCQLDAGEDLDSDGVLDGGTPARFVRGRIRLPSDDAANWLDTASGTAAAAYLRDGEPNAWDGDPALGATDDGTFLEKLHLWVEAQVDLGNYRGSEDSQRRRTWVPLDPSYKLRDRQSGIVLPIGSGLSFDYADYYATVKQELPLEIFADQVRDYLVSAAGPGGAVADVPTSGPIRVVAPSVIPTALPYELSSALLPTRDDSLIPLHTHPGKSPSADAGAVGADDYRYRASIEVCTDNSCVSSVLLYVDDMATLEGMRITLNYPPDAASVPAVAAAGGYTACLANVTTIPTLSLDGVALSAAATGAVPQMLCDPQTVVVSTVLPLPLGNSNTTGDTMLKSAYDVPAGGTYHIAFDTGSGDATSFQLLTEALVSEIERISIDPVDDTPLIDGLPFGTQFQGQEETTGRLLELVGHRYFILLREAYKEAIALHHEIPIHTPMTGLIEARPVVEVLLGAPFMLRPSQLVVDIRGAVSPRAERTTGLPPADPFPASATLYGHHGSALEHAVWEELADAEAISTVKGFQLRAEQEGVGIAFVTNKGSAQAAMQCNLYNSGDLTTNELFNQTPGSTSSFTCSNIDVATYCLLKKTWVPHNTTSGTVQALIQAVPGGPTGGLTTVNLNMIPPATNDPRYWRALHWDLFALGCQPGVNSNIVSQRFAKSPSLTFSYAGWQGSVFFVQAYLNPGTDPAEGYFIDSAFTEPLEGGWVTDYQVVNEQLFDAANAPLSFDLSLGFGLSDDFFDYNLKIVDTDPFHSNFVFDPVNVVSGNLHYETVDLAFPGRGGFGLTLRRAYNSRLDYDGPLGYGWIHTYDQHLRVETADSEVVWVDENGGESPFSDIVGPGPLTPPTWSTDTLVRNADSTLTLTTKFGMIYHFDVPNMADRSNLLSVTDRNGNQISLQYDAVNIDQLNTVTDSAGRILQFAHDAAGKVSSVTDMAGGPPRTWEYFVNGNGDLERFTDPIGVALADGSRDVLFEYLSGQTNVDLDHNMTKMTLPAPRGDGTEREFTEWEYYANDTVFRTRNALGEEEQIVYNRFRRRTTVSHADGTSEHYIYDSVGNVTRHENARGIAREYEFEDGTRRRLSETDPYGKKTLASWDAFENMTSRTDRLTNSESWSYNSFSQPLTHTDRRGNLQEWQYDPNGNLLEELAVIDGALETLRTHAYDTFGNRTETTEFTTAGGAETRTTRFQYASNGVDLLRQIDAQGHDTRFEVDGLGRTTATEMTRTLHGGHEIVRGEVVYDDLSRPVIAIDPVGTRGRTIRDENGRTAAQLTYLPDPQDPPGFVPDLAACPTTPGCRVEAQAVFDAVGRQVEAIDAQGNTTTVAFNERGWPVSTTTALGFETRYSYDEDGNLIHQLDPTGAETFLIYDASDRMVEKRDALDRPTTISYDAEGQVLQVVGPGSRTLAKVVNYDAEGNPTLVEDAAGVQGSAVYDELGRKTSATAAIGELDPQSNLIETTTQFVFSLDGNLIQKIDPLDRSTQLRYDVLGRLVEREDALGRKTAFAYDELGNRVLSANPAGDRIRFEYDARGLLTRRVSEASASSIPIDDRYAYDGLGRQVLAEGGGVSRQYSYDALDRVVALTDSANGTLGQQYDADGRMIQLSYPDGSRTHYGYTPRGELATIRDIAAVGTGAPGAWTFEYDELGRTTRRTDPFGVLREVSYTLEGFIDEVEVRNASGLVELHSYDAYDSLGNPLEINTTEGKTEASYDALSRLTKVAYPGGDFAGCTTACERFEYDLAGNRTKQVESGTERNYQIDLADQLTRITDAMGADLETFQHDAAGRRIARTVAGATTAYTYDPLGRLSLVLGPGSFTSLNYNASDERYNRTDTAGNALYFGEWMETRAGETVRLVHGSGIDRVVAEVTTAGSVRTLTRDGSANVTHVAVDGAFETAPRRYEAFGSARSGSSAVERGFAGRPTEGSTGLVNIRARHYDPSTGRFLQEDPLGVEADQAYSYAASNPFRLADPSGLRPTSINDFFLANLQGTPGYGFGFPATGSTLGDRINLLSLDVSSQPGGGFGEQGGVGGEGRVDLAFLLPEAAPLAIPAREVVKRGVFGVLGLVAETLAAPFIAAAAIVLTPTELADGRRQGPIDVRLQAQGRGLEQSVVINSGQSEIVTATDGLTGLTKLEGLLTGRELDARERSFQRARRFITNAATGGGVGPGRFSFPAGPGTDIRVDIEVLRGLAFTPGPRSDALIR